MLTKTTAETYPNCLPISSSSSNNNNPDISSINNQEKESAMVLDDIENILCQIHGDQ